MPTLRASLFLAAAVLAGCSDGKPASHLSASSTRLVRYQTCSDLESDLKAMLYDEAKADLEQIRDYPFPAEDGGDGDPSAGGDPPREEGEDYSGTNNQEDGVDEADLVKTDGYHIYTLNGNRLHIFGVPEFGQLVPESVTELEGHPTQLVVDRDAEKAAIFSIIDVYSLPPEHPLRALVGWQDDERWYWRVQQLTKITVLDVSDRSAPQLVREVYVEGWYATAREIDGSVRLATYAWMEVPLFWELWSKYYELGEDVGATLAWARDRLDETTLAELIPQVYVRTPDGAFTTETLEGDACQSFQRPTDSHARGVASIVSFDLFGETAHFDSDQVLANYPTFYASKDTLVITEMANDWWWFWYNRDDVEKLNVHAFDISQAGTTTYLASGRVEGTLFDPFSIDEEDGYLRLATTTDRWARWWQEDPREPENHVWVLARNGDQLEQVGHVGDIARGEQITAARLIGDKGFLVTFEQTDPLFTLDLSDPRDPRVVGELKVPGFSTYLHPIAGDKLLSIGYGGDEDGTNWKTQISLFDVSDFAHPSLAAALPLELGEGWGWSEAAWEHKAFTYWAPEKLLAVPQATYEYVGTTEEGWTDYRYLSRLELVSVDGDAGTLTRKGSIDHSEFYNSEDPEWGYWAYVDIRRSIFMGDYVYALSDRAITVHRTADLAPQTVQLLPGYGPNDYYWWW